MMNLTVANLQRFHGSAVFLVLFGSMYARQVTVRYMDRAFFEDLWAQGKYPQYTRKEFERNVLDEIGIVHANFSEVPPDVVRAVWEDLAFERACDPEHFAKFFTTGSYTVEGGWVTSNVRASLGETIIDSDACHVMDPIQVPTVHVQSLLQRPVH